MTDNDRHFGCFYLHPTFSNAHFFSYLSAVFVTIMCFVYVQSNTALLLENQKYLFLLSVFDELASIPAEFMWGFVSDVKSRRLVYTIGFIILSFSLFLFPLSKSFWYIVGIRIIYAIGCSACAPMISAVLADCSGKLRGRIAGMTGVCSGLGAVFAIFVLNNFLEKVLKDLHFRFLVTGFSVLSFAFVFYICTRKKMECLKPQIKITSAFVKAITVKDWRIWVAYMCSAAARINTTLPLLYVPSWVTTENGNYLRVISMVALICAPLCGFFIDLVGATTPSKRKLQHPVLPTLLASALLVVAYLLVFYLGNDNGNDLLTNIYFGLVGLGQIATILTGMSIISSSYVDPSLRGTFSGAYSIFGTVGILVCSTICHFFTGKYPFLIFAFFHIALFVLCILAMIFGKGVEHGYQPKSQL